MKARPSAPAPSLSLIEEIVANASLNRAIEFALYRHVADGVDGHHHLADKKRPARDLPFRPVAAGHFVDTEAPGDEHD